MEEMCGIGKTASLAPGAQWGSGDGKDRKIMDKWQRGISGRGTRLLKSSEE